MMRKYPLITLLLALPALISAQTNISGIINSYYRVVEVIPAKACVRVDITTGLANNDRVMLVQMKGATVNTPNNSTFGSVISLSNAGNYELGTVCSINGDSVFLYRQIFQSYTIADKVQLVRIPQYNSAIVTGSLQAAPWDSATGKGGVLALSVFDDLVLNAPISANDVGYRGGAYVVSGGTCSNLVPLSAYSYNGALTPTQNGAYKGESVASIASNITGGKGAYANGGGGGNNHNNGGGGGGNLGTGGMGGGNSSTTGCSVSNPGIGAYSLTNSSGTKLYMGGGGGAGHANSGVPEAGGGRGGGIIFIHANNLQSNGFKISATGQAGGNAVSDGASGGGGGGSIILDINNYADAVAIEAIGGNGGTEDEQGNLQRCYGEGGGGGGGAIFFKTAQPAGSVSVAGGLKGVRLGSSPTCGPIIASTAGGLGSISSTYSFIQSGTVSSTCGGWPLPVQMIYFNAFALPHAAALEWEMGSLVGIEQIIVERKEVGSWKEIKRFTTANAIPQFSYRDLDLQKGQYQYRLRIVASNGKTEYSIVKNVTIIQSDKFLLYPNPAINSVTIQYNFHAGTKLQIINNLGQLVFTKNFNAASTVAKQDISFLKTGIYHVIVDEHVSNLIVK